MNESYHYTEKDPHHCYKQGKDLNIYKKSRRIDAMKLREIGFECSPPL